MDNPMLITKLVGKFAKTEYSEKDVKDRYLSALYWAEPGSEKAKNIIDDYAQFCEARSANEHPVATEIGKAVVSGFITLTGIILITDFEKDGVITSKAIQFIPKPKIF